MPIINSSVNSHRVDREGVGGIGRRALSVARDALLPRERIVELLLRGDFDRRKRRPHRWPLRLEERPQYRQGGTGEQVERLREPIRAQSSAGGRENRASRFLPRPRRQLRLRFGTADLEGASLDQRSRTACLRRLVQRVRYQSESRGDRLHIGYGSNRKRHVQRNPALGVGPGGRPLRVSRQGDAGLPQILDVHFVLRWLGKRYRSLQRR
ncbi:hypothetical protein TSAR_013471 [Trichomalopsis sarcophagae]|uniref:Uncharacterized protein n=1 Tax=Trichomalopsis sarcophagae TaxID=543379 RepID=A0A232EJ72_9HYME|nr:hypothetical protein TSAR_013471 [Trichomalopsis sarcophagae]